MEAERQIRGYYNIVYSFVVLTHKNDVRMILSNYSHLEFYETENHSTSEKKKIPPWNVFIPMQVYVEDFDTSETFLFISFFLNKLDVPV